MKRRIVTWFLTLACCVSATAPARGNSLPQKWAVVIGIDKYQHAGLVPLDCAVADARSLARTLETTAGFPRDNVFVLTSDLGGDQAPTRTNIAFRFDYLRRVVKPEDTLLVFFSGHGVEVEGQSFLLTMEADARSLMTLQQSALPARDLMGWLGTTSAGNTLLVVDACRNEPAQARGGADNLLTDTLARDLALVNLPARPGASAQKPVSTATLFACSAGQRSYEWHDRGHGFFTYYLVEGLKGEAADAQGKVTLSRLFEYLQNQVSSSSQRWTLQRQVPWLRYEGPGAHLWVLAESAKPTAAAEPAAQPTAGSAAAKAAAAAEPAAQAAPDPAAQERLRQAEERARAAEVARLEAEARARQAEEKALLASAAPSSAGRELPVASLPETPTEILVVSGSGGTPFRTIGHAIQKAPEGARIVVKPGTYSEVIVIRKALEIVGEGAPGEVVVRVQKPHAVEVRTSSAVRIRGLTLECLNADEAVLGKASVEECRSREIATEEREKWQPRVDLMPVFRLCR